MSCHDKDRCGNSASVGVFVWTRGVCPGCRAEFERRVLEKAAEVIHAFTEEKGWEFTKVQDEGEHGPVGTPTLILPEDGKVH